MKITLEYDGSRFHGFQSQRELRTVQSKLEAATARLFGHPTKVVGAGRTDAGVHARAQVVSVLCAGSIPTPNIARALNSLLPDDMAVTEVIECEPRFNANRLATSKVYRYYFCCDALRSAFYGRYSLLVRGDLDAEAMAAAAAHFVGTHDFSAFRAAGSAVKTSTRAVLDSRIEKCSCGRELLRFQVEAGGFLYNMVRIMAGTLLEVGRGKIKPGDIPDIIASKDRRRAGPTVGPEGLWLWKVRYPAPFS